MNYDLQRFIIGSNPTLLARIADEAGNLFTANSFSYITANVRHKATGRTPTGFDALAVPLSSVSPKLQTGEPWKKDTIGYNFSYTLPGTVGAPALPWVGEYYIHVTFVRVSGVPFVLRFEVEVQ